MDTAAIIWLSAKVAATAVAGSLPFAFAAAWLVARTRLPGRSLLQAAVMLPLVLPPVVTGFLLLNWFGKNGFAGQFLNSVFGLSFSFNWLGAALAAGVMAFPLLVRPIRLSLEGIDRGLEEAARTLGASRLRCFLTVTLPLCLPGIAAAFTLGLAKAMGEFGATITFVGNIPGETQTLSLAIYSMLQTPDGDAAATTLIWLSVALGAVAILASEWIGQILVNGNRDERNRD
jgi:molybdate transport system permease protein